MPVANKKCANIDVFLRRWDLSLKRKEESVEIESESLRT